MFSGWLARIGAAFAILAAAVGSVLAYGAKQKRDGRVAERLRRIKEEAEANDEARGRIDDALRDSPTDADAADDWLRQRADRNRK